MRPAREYLATFGRIAATGQYSGSRHSHAMRSLSLLAVLLVATACSAPATPATDGSTVPPTTRPPATSPVTAQPTTTATVVIETTTTVPPTTTTATPLTALVVTDGVVAGPESISVVLGEEAAFTVTADVIDEVHVHGYDIHFDVEPGIPTEVRFVADVPGVFEVELEAAGLPLVELVVEP